ncbi:unnamed protein product [Closterium sp. NIES-54]
MIYLYMVRPASVLVTIVGAIGDAGVVDNLETRLADARRRHADGEYGETIPLEVVELGIRAKWAAEHPSRLASPRLVNNEGGVDQAVMEEEVDVGSAGCAATPTTSPTNGLTEVTPTTTTPREVEGGRLGEQAAQGKAVDQVVDLGKGRRLLLWRTGTRRQGGVVLAGRRRGADSLAGAGGFEDFQAMAVAVQANPVVVLLDSGCSHHLMGTNEAFVDLEPSGDVKHLKESGVKLQDEGDGMLVVSTIGDVLGRATYTGWVLCTKLRLCTTTSTSTTTETVALRTIATATKSTPARWHVRLAHIGVDTITSSAKHEVATVLDIKSSPGTDSPCVSCVGGKLAQHTFPDKGFDADDGLAIVHIDPCGPFWVAAKDRSLYFLPLKDRKTRYVWVRPVAKNSDMLPAFEKGLVVVERQLKKSVLMLCSDRVGEFLKRPFTDFVDGDEPLEVVSTMAGPEERGGRGAGGSGEAQAQGQPRDPTMSPMQPSLGPPRGEPTVFGLDKFNGDNFAEWSFKMENIFDHYDLLEVMEGTEKRPESDPEKSPWVQKSAQGYLLLGQALGSSQIRHIKPFQRELEKGPKAWAALKGVHALAKTAVAVVLERQMATLRIEEDEAFEEGVQKFFDLLTRLEGADLNNSELQKKTKLPALLPESWSSLIINLNHDLPRLSLEDVKRAILQVDFRRRELASADGARAASIGRGYGCGRGRGRGGGRFGSYNFNGGHSRGGAANMKNGDNESESRDDRFPGQFFFVSTQAPAAPEKDESFEEPAAVGKVTLHSLDYWVIDSGATYSMTPLADLLTELELSPVKHVTSALGQRVDLKGMGKAMFKGADGKMVGLKNVLWVPKLAANLISVRRLQKAGMDMSSKGAKTYTARLNERILWELYEDRDVYNEMWQIPVVPMPKERQVPASISTKGEAVGSGDGTNGRAKEIESKKCNLGGTSKLSEHEESGAAA